ncbi:MAG TPA: phage tail protein [Saprospirales bacterium]|nr:phage tail protein [Saprospirales bacterium]
MEGTLATIMIFGGNFAPTAWMFCAGQLLSIAEYNALFSLLGTTYGGDGQTTFALPDLRGRIPVGTGTGGGLTTINLGQAAGSESITLTEAQLPAHIHPMIASVSTSSSNADGSNSPAKVLATPTTNLYAPTSAATNNYLGGASVSLAPQGGSQPISTLQPYLALNYVICVEGAYPSRP